LCAQELAGRLELAGFDFGVGVGFV